MIPNTMKLLDLRSNGPKVAKMRCLTRASISALLGFSQPRLLRAQGGPPMITDDPGTPGNGHWENNIAVIFEHRPNETSWDSPLIDLNYGVGEHIQLTLQGGPVLLKRSGHGLIGGLGGTEAAVKWRFLDEEKSGFDVSMFPRVLFNITQSSVRRGLAEDGTRFQIPFELAKTFGRFHADAEVGPLTSTVGRSEWIYGIVGGVELGENDNVDGGTARHVAHEFHPRRSDHKLRASSPIDRGAHLDRVNRP